MSGLGRFHQVFPIVNPDRGFISPPGRSGHCAVIDDTNMYVYGGFNPDAGPPLGSTLTGLHAHMQFKTQVMTEVLQFNLASHTWTSLNTTDIPETAASSSLCIIGNTLLAYGGTIVPWGKVMSNSFRMCDLRTKSWRKVQATSKNNPGDIPLPGYGQSIVFHNDKLYVFTGAVSYVGDPVSELHMFDLHTNQWERTRPTGDIPEGRYKQGMILHNNRLVLIGGGLETKCASLNHIYIYHLDSDIWERRETLPYADTLYPKPRACFGCVLHEDWLYIFGGRLYAEDQNEEILQDTWRLNLKTFWWQRLRHLFLPVCVSFPTACLASNGYVYIYGGILQTTKRSSKIYRAQIFIPKLAELSFEKVMSCIRLHNTVVDSDTFKSLGIPCNFLGRLQAG